jgi:class 3 adenylate cyclase
MRTWPRGVVTFLFADIEDSTASFERVSDAVMNATLAKYHGLLEDTINARRGKKYNRLGDAVQAAFTQPEDAVEAAVDIQRALASADWGEFGTLKARIALHTGNAAPNQGNYTARPLYFVHRLMSVAHGGQVLLSQATAELVRYTVPAGTVLKDLGGHKLRSMTHTDHIFQLTISDIKQDFPALTIPESNLPGRLIPLVGPDSAAAAVIESTPSARSPSVWYDRQITGLLDQPYAMFVLWALQTRLCKNLGDFYLHFGREIRFDKLLSSLDSLGLIQIRDSELLLTSDGHALLAQLPKLPQFAGEGLLIGLTAPSTNGRMLEVRLPASDRQRHMYVVGKAGTGKSMLLLSMVLQDIRLGNGVCLIDPRGNLVDALLAMMPEEREQDVLIFDPSDRSYVPGLNFLESTTGSEDEQDYIIQEITSILLRKVDFDLQMFGPIAEQSIRFGCMTIMDLPRDSALGGTLMEVPKLFTDHQFLEDVLKEISNPVLKQYWKDEFLDRSDAYKSEVVTHVASKLASLTSTSVLRSVIGQLHSSIDFGATMDEKKILLVNLPTGLIGQRNSEILGSMVVCRILWSALHKAWLPDEQQAAYYLYIDEFQDFATDSFETILAEARKYNLSLTMAHRHLGQLSAMGDMGKKLERAIFGTVGAITAFQAGSDAHQLAREMGKPVGESTLRNLANRVAVTRLLLNDTPTVPFTMKTIDVEKPTVEQAVHGRYLKARILQEHVPLRAAVNEEIRLRHG